MRKFFVKNGIFICSVIILLILAATMAIFVRDISGMAASALPESGYTVILDAGHGGEDGGAVTLTGGTEKEINLSVAKKAERIFALCGVPVRMTRETDTLDYPKSATTTRKRKAADTRQRTVFIDSITNGVLVSIHQNKFSADKYARGAVVFYAPTDKSRELAESLTAYFEASFVPEKVRACRKIDKDIYIMNRVSCPAVLVECGFVSNAEECALLESDGYQTKLAAAVACGIISSAEIIIGGTNEA